MQLQLPPDDAYRPDPKLSDDVIHKAIRLVAVGVIGLIGFVFGFSLLAAVAIALTRCFKFL